MKVSQAIQGCSTGQISGLSKQVIEVLLKENRLVKINHPLIVCSGRQNNPYLQPLAYQQLVKAVERRNQKIIINSCLRTVMQQYMLQQQKLGGICGIRAAAPPGKSGHNSGLAIDIEDSRNWINHLKPFGWKWIGQFDPMHFDFSPYQRGWRSQLVNLSQLQTKAFQELWNKHNQTKLKVDGFWGTKTAKAVSQSPSQGFGKPPVMRRGDYSYEVSQLQFLLKQKLGAAGKDLLIDSHFGSATEEALFIFQKMNGLKADGIAGAKTMAVLSA